MSTVSVIIPAHNQGHYLGQAISSVLAQSYQDFEIVVVDDGSTDHTTEVVRGFADSRLHYVYQQNSGLSAARNTGIRQSTGSFLTFLDSDDLFLPEKLQLLVGALERRRELGLAAGQAVLIDETGQPLGEVFERGLPDDSSQLLLGNPLHVGSVLIRREWQEQVGFFDETLRSYEDWDMWLRLARAGCLMGWVARPVSLYRFHREQMTQNGDQMTTATFAVLDKTYKNLELPEDWLELRNQAYSRAYLRAAAQSYSARDFTRATGYMSEAVRLSPELCANNAEPLALRVAGWANYVKTREPLTFLESIYDHLPAELAVMGQRRNRDLSREAMQLAFAAYRRGEFAAARWATWRAMGYQHRLLVDRGAISIFVRSSWRLSRSLKTQMLQSFVSGLPLE